MDSMSLVPFGPAEQKATLSAGGKEGGKKPIENLLASSKDGEDSPEAFAGAFAALLGMGECPQDVVAGEGVEEIAFSEEMFFPQGFSAEELSLVMENMTPEALSEFSGVLPSAVLPSLNRTSAPLTEATVQVAEGKPPQDATALLELLSSLDRKREDVPSEGLLSEGALEKGSDVVVSSAVTKEALLGTEPGSLDKSGIAASGEIMGEQPCGESFSEIPLKAKEDNSEGDFSRKEKGDFSGKNPEKSVAVESSDEGTAENTLERMEPLREQHYLPGGNFSQQREEAPSPDLKEPSSPELFAEQRAMQKKAKVVGPSPSRKIELPVGEQVLAKDLGKGVRTGELTEGTLPLQGEEKVSSGLKQETSAFSEQKEDSQNFQEMLFRERILPEKAVFSENVSEDKIGGEDADVSQRFAGAGMSVRTPVSPQPVRSSAAFPLPQSGPASLSSGIAQTVRIIRTSEGDRAQIVVEPPALGRVEISLSSTAQGMSAVLRVDNEGLRQILQSQIDLLRSSLQQQGISVTDLSVDVRHGNEDSSSGRDSSGNSRKRKIPGLSGKYDLGDEEDLFPVFRLDMEQGLLHWVA